MKLESVFWMILSLSIPAAGAGGRIESFEELWTRVQERSPELRAGNAAVNAAGEGARRARWHWAPKLSLDGRAYSTNDPGSVLFGRLSQRAVGSGDFDPAALNWPGMNSFATFGMGFDLPVFEGGKRNAEADAEIHLLAAARADRAVTLDAVYADTARDYARILVLDSVRDRLLEVRARLQGVLDRYSVGAVGNPVGYSGWLGLKGLKNRVEAALREVESERSTARREMELRAGLDGGDWIPRAEPLLAFVEQHLPLPVQKEESPREEGARLRGEAQASVRQAERARFLPRVGLFGNEGLTLGSRGTGTQTTVGMYLQWNLFDPGNLGRLEEGRNRETAAREAAAAVVLQRRIEEGALKSTDQTVRGNLDLLRDSEHLLAEQTGISFRLFQSGALSALQLAEVLNRRVDLVLELRRMEEQWVRIRSDLRRISGDSRSMP